MNKTMNSPQIRAEDAEDGDGLETMSHQIPCLRHWNMEEIAAMLSIKVRRIGLTEQMLTMILDSMDAPSTRTIIGGLWGIKPDFIIDGGRVSWLESPHTIRQSTVEQLPHSPTNPFVEVTAAKATYGDGGLSPQQRLDGVTDILAAIAARVVKNKLNNTEIRLA